MAQASKLLELFEGDTAFDEGYQRAQTYLRIGAELRTLREAADMTQAELAGKAGLDQGDISRLELGKWGSRGISFDVLGKLLPVFGLRIAHEVVVHPGANTVQRAKAKAISGLLHDVV